MADQPLDVGQALLQLAHYLGLDAWLPILLAINTLFRALDAAIPQPAPGSHWVPVRKILSWLALGFLHATPANQPALVTWFERVVIAVATTPPPRPSATPAPTQPAERRAAPFPPAITLKPPANQP